MYFGRGHNYAVRGEPAPGGENMVAAGDIIWESDLTALQNLSQGNPAVCTLECIAAKYLVNQPRDY